jgi:hypothetical protein
LKKCGLTAKRGAGERRLVFNREAIASFSLAGRGTKPMQQNVQVFRRLIILSLQL